jgi:hypothetical protein
MQPNDPPRYDTPILDALACDIRARPTAAPHFGDLQHALKTVRREDDSLVAEFDPSAAATLEAIVAAERLCCPEITWLVEQPRSKLAGAGDSTLRLRVVGTPQQLDAVALLFDSGTPEP